MEQRPVIMIVDDDEGTRNSLCRLFHTAGYETRPFATAKDFLNCRPPDDNACLILDLRMPEMGGLELLDALKASGMNFPVILYTGHADVPITVRVMQAGAFEVIEKPFSGDLLVERVRQAMARYHSQRQRQVLIRSARESLASLTAREHEVAQLLADGLSAAEVGSRLHISARTVETHRSRILDKLNIRSVAELAKLTLAATLGGEGPSWHPGGK